MDVIQSVLHLAPVPYLSVAFSVFRFIWDSVQQVKASKEQLRILSLVIAQLLRTLNQEYKAGRLTKVRTSGALQDLARLLEEILAFVQKHTAQGFLKSLYTKGDRITQIDAYHRQLAFSIDSFQVSSLIDIQDWQQKNELARASDQQALDERLADLERNQNNLLEALDANHENTIAMIVSLHRYLERRSADDQETRFLSHSLRCLTTASGRQVEVQNWMITSFEVEFADKIGSGGFGQIYRGTWNGTQVAIKVLKSDGVIPRSASVRREIEIWSKLLHPHVLQFLGANVLDENPFLVMPYLPKGNALDYVQDHPHCNRVKILHDISLGLVYLHSQNVVHGDLKAMNVLLDDSNKAVLCDFSLSRIKVDVSTRTTSGDVAFMVGSRFWMSPERLTGKSLRRPSDVYAFGMTIFEIYTHETPLGEVPYINFYSLVVTQGLRPDRPEPSENTEMTDEIWNLAECCWVAEPGKRPTAASIRDTLKHILDRISTPTHDVSHRESSSTQHPRPSPQTTIPESQLANPAPIVHHTRESRLPLKLSSRECQTGHTSDILTLTFSPNGEWLASGSKDGTIRLHPMATKSGSERVLTGHDNWIWSVDFSSDGTRIVSGSLDQRIIVWDVKTASNILEPVSLHTKAVRSVKFSPDGKHFISGSWDRTVRVWDARTGEMVLGPLQGHTAEITTVAFSPDGTQIISGAHDDTLIVWDAQSGDLIVGPLHGRENIEWVEYSTDGRMALSVATDAVVRIWDVQKWVVLYSFPVMSLRAAFLPDGRRFVAQAVDGTISIWDLETQRVVYKSAKHEGRVWAIAISPDGRHIACSAMDSSIWVYSLD